MNRSWTIVMLLVASTCVGQEPNQGGEVRLDTVDLDKAMASFTLPDGYLIELVASEQDSAIKNPVSLCFDSRGRMLVACMPSYPMVEPAGPPANDYVVLFDDSDGDGAYDRDRKYVEGLNLPTGVECGDGGVFVVSQPNLVFARDADGDGVIEGREIVMHGFGAGDTHHAMSAFTWGPGGGLQMAEGIFHHSAIETPHGTVRLKDGGILRFDPVDQRLEVHVNAPFYNPWGQVFDRWGNYYIADASDGSNHFGSLMTGRIDWPRKHHVPRDFTVKVRPTAGCELISTPAFPAETQGDFVVANCIGFRGIKQHRVIEDGAGVRSEPVHDLLVSSDPNFRPVDLQLGPDGALYVVDWFNPLIGHMQYSLFDDRRDHGHGRIWRIRHRDGELMKPLDLSALSEAALLDLLNDDVDRTRYRVRRELRGRDPGAVQSALQDWTPRGEGADLERRLLEALWVRQGSHLVDEAALDRLLASPEPRARAAATHVLRFWRDRVADPLEKLERLVVDADPRVRREALTTLSWLGGAAAAEAALRALDHPVDAALEYVLGETLTQLEDAYTAVLAAGGPFCVKRPEHRRHAVARLSVERLLELPRDEDVLGALVRKKRADVEVRARALRELHARGAVDAASEVVSLVEAYAAGEGDPADLLELFFSVPREQAAPQAAKLVALIDVANGAVRRFAWRALAHAGVPLAERWALAETSGRRLVDLLAELDHEPGTAAFEARVLELAVTEVEDRGDRVRFVRVDVPGEERVINVAEIEVLSGDENLALDATASSSSVDWEGPPSLAIDGKIEQGYGGGGNLAHTKVETDPWIEIDLLEPRAIDTVRVWNRDEPPWDRRLDDFRLTLLDGDRRVVHQREHLPAPMHVASYDLGRTRGAAVRVAAADAWIRWSAGTDGARRLLAVRSPEPRLRDHVVDALVDRDRGEWSDVENRTLAGFVFASLRDVTESRRGSSRHRRLITAAETLLRDVPESERIDAAALLDGARAEVLVIPTPERFEIGRGVFVEHCSKCHVADGRGVPGAFPPLRGSEIVGGEAERLVRIVLHGIEGKVEVAGSIYDAAMDPLGALLGDEQIADVLSFVRNAWGNRFPLVTPTLVGDVRRRHAGRQNRWTPGELGILPERR